MLTDSALDNSRVQEFVLTSPVEARYVKLVPIDNWGSTCCVGVKSFEVIERGLAGVPSHFVLPPTPPSRRSWAASSPSRAEQHHQPLRGQPDRRETSPRAGPPAQNLRTNQSVVIELGKGKTYRWTACAW